MYEQDPVNPGGKSGLGGGSGPLREPLPLQPLGSVLFPGPDTFVSMLKANLGFIYGRYKSHHVGYWGGTFHPRSAMFHLKPKYNVTC